MNASRAIALVVLSLACTSCVTTGRFEAVVAKQKEADSSNARLANELARARGDAQTSETKTKAQQDQIDVLTHMVDELTRERTALGTALDRTKAQARAAEFRAQVFRTLALRLKKMTDAGSLSFSLRDGRMVLSLPNDVLFDSGSSTLSKPGIEALKQVAAVLRELPKRRYQVAGHTDDVPIQTAQFPSNWELSTARATRVVKLLADEGVPQGVLSAAGYGEFDPVAPNDVAPSRARNRRIEITLVPNVDELVAVP